MPISGRDPVVAGNKVAISNVKLGTDSLTMDVASTGAGTLNAYLWSGLEGEIPVFTTSCQFENESFLDYGLSACAITDGGYPRGARIRTGACRPARSASQ